MIRRRQPKHSLAIALLAVVLSFWAFVQRAQATVPVEKHAQATLIADTSAIKPGQPFRLGVAFKLEPGWHTYYKEPGDAGMPTRIEFKLPPGFKASQLLWQKPERFDESGIITYGYQNAALFGAVITPPKKLNANDKLTISANVTYLVCKELCVPGEDNLSISMPVSDAPAAQNEAIFSTLGFVGPVSAIKTVSHETSTAEPAFSGNVLATNFQVQDESPKQLSLWAYLGFAFLGGFILNFMPCVLPCIAIKLLSFLKQAGDEPKEVFKLGAIFSAGIVGSFLALAAAVVAIKAAGQNVGWGFQFQYPLFLLVMSAVVLVFALSLFGLFYVQVSAGQQQIDKLAAKEGPVGTFSKGVLATILSTPCSAPFLGPALGFAFAQPAWVIFAMFFAIGMGMACPYLVLTANPAWMKFLPKPGAWMEKFKEAMGFLLLATSVWLVWVLGQQVGLNAAMAAVGFLVWLSLAVWIAGRFIDLSSTVQRKSVVYTAAAACIVAGYVTCLSQYPQLLSMAPAVGSENIQPAVAITGGGNSGIVWQPFSIDKLDQNLKDGKTVFLDFTADWCLTCKVNESTVLNTKPVMDKFAALNVVTMKADWTKQDDNIRQLLEKFGRRGVPLYVIFPASRPTKPIVLPEVITQSLVISKLEEAGPSRN